MIDNMGRLIVIDGLDGSGKATQTQALLEYLCRQNYPARAITFPNYNSRSSELVKMYLQGEIASTAQEVNAYASASFYACDRYISYRTEWESDYCEGKLILADRYVSSNAIHQMVKLPKSEWDRFLDWIYDYEYGRLGLPKENQLIYLDMDPTVSHKLLSSRYSGDESKRDLHEKDDTYLLRCREAAYYAAKKNHWDIVRCDNGEVPYSISEIFDIIKKKVEVFLSVC